MKALSIGREQGCDIVINDSTDVISRRHAILNISSSGKITIVDQSRNGTYVNGIRISQNVPVPVTRKDIISFAHVAKLDWNAVPNQFHNELYHYGNSRSARYNMWLVCLSIHEALAIQTVIKEKLQLQIPLQTKRRK